MYTESDFEKITEIFRENIKELNQLILFGSYARGTASEESDIDIIAVIEKPVPRDDKLAILGNLWKKLGPMGYRTDIILKDRVQYENDKTKLMTMSHYADHEGKYLWTKK
jgi:predicted nucleotidyltransferase